MAGHVEDDNHGNDRQHSIGRYVQPEAQHRAKRGFPARLLGEELHQGKDAVTHRQPQGPGSDAGEPALQRNRKPPQDQRLRGDNGRDHQPFRIVQVPPAPERQLERRSLQWEQHQRDCGKMMVHPRVRRFEGVENGRGIERGTATVPHAGSGLMKSRRHRITIGQVFRDEYHEGRRDRDQEQRFDMVGTPPIDVIADQVAGADHQILQRVQDSAIHVQHAVLEFMPEEMPVDAMRRRGLAAGRAELLVRAIDCAVATGATARIQHLQFPPRAMARPIFSEARTNSAPISSPTPPRTSTILNDLHRIYRSNATERDAYANRAPIAKAAR